MIIKINSKKFSLSAQMLLVSLILGLFFFQGYFIDLGVTENIKYILDILNLFFLFTMLKQKRRLDAVNIGILVFYIILTISGSLVMLVNADIWETNISCCPLLLMWLIKIVKI